MAGFLIKPDRYFEHEAFERECRSFYRQWRSVTLTNRPTVFKRTPLDEWYPTDCKSNGQTGPRLPSSSWTTPDQVSTAFERANFGLNSGHTMLYSPRITRFSLTQSSRMAFLPSESLTKWLTQSWSDLADINSTMAVCSWKFVSRIYLSTLLEKFTIVNEFLLNLRMPTKKCQKLRHTGELPRSR